MVRRSSDGPSSAGDNVPHDAAAGRVLRLVSRFIARGQVFQKLLLIYPDAVPALSIRSAFVALDEPKG